MLQVKLQYTAIVYINDKKENKLAKIQAVAMKMHPNQRNASWETGKRIILATSEKWENYFNIMLTTIRKKWKERK